jgi:hypothetical protein
MILSFKTHHNGRPTHFVEKIWQSFFKFAPKCHGIDVWDEFMIDCGEKGFSIFGDYEEKRHTIRHDINNRWKPGMMIDFFINARQKDMFRFAPRIPVVSVQQIHILYEKVYPSEIPLIKVYIDGNLFYSESDVRIPYSADQYRRMMQLARNDGFHNIVDFFAWFNKDFTGKIIHWTDLKY